jgi:hypothetical protein
VSKDARRATGDSKAQLFGLYRPRRYFCAMNAAYDELPGVSVSRLRALGDITEEMKVATIKLGQYEFAVGLSLFRWPNGGSWSFFVCPCGRRARILRLFEGGLTCCRCLKARGLHARIELIRTERRSALLTPKRLERLKSEAPARLNPRPGRMLDRRTNIELALKRSLIVARRAKIVQFEKDLG